MSKLEMLNEMFLGTQFQKHISGDMKSSKSRIETVYNYFISHSTDVKRVVFCSTLLS